MTHSGNNVHNVAVVLDAMEHWSLFTLNVLSILWWPKLSWHCFRTSNLIVDDICIV